MADLTDEVNLSTELTEAAWEGLVKAASRGNYNAVKAFLPVCLSRIDQRTDDMFGYTALLYATMLGHEACVKLLLESGADPSVADSQCNQTPLLLASRYGQFHLIPLLIEYRSPIDLPDSYGQTALQWAAWKTHVDGLQLLRMGGENILDGTVGYTRFKNLVWAADDVDLEPVLYLIKHGANIYAEDFFSKDTVLARCNTATAAIVVSYTKKLWHETEIHECIYKNDQQQLTTLLAGNARDETVDEDHTFDGWLAIHLAAYLHRTDLVKIIIDSDYNGKYAVIEGTKCTALHIAAQKGFSDILQLFDTRDEVGFIYDHDKEEYSSPTISV